MSLSKSPKTPKTPKSLKSSKSSKSGKEKPNLEFSSKFHGKYDLSKNKKNDEISLENAVNLFELISKKNPNLYKNNKIKMYKEQKMFSFTDQKSLVKVHHHVPYSQMRKFFVLRKDPSIVLLGVHHNNHKCFLVFQFETTTDLQKFCDELEGKKIPLDNDYDYIENKRAYDTVDTAAINVLEILEDDRTKTDNKVEKISIHSEMYTETLNAAENSFRDSCFDLELESDNIFSQTSFLEEATPTICSSRASSKNSIKSDFDSKYHCDNMSNSRLKDLLMSTTNVFYDLDDWEENLTCMEYPKNFLKPQINRKGPVYIYSARHKVTWYEVKETNHLDSSYSEEEDNDSFNKYNAKFYNHEPKMISKGNDLDVFYNHEPKMNNAALTNLNKHKSKNIQKEKEENIFENHDPKMIERGADLDKFEKHDRIKQSF